MTITSAGIIAAGEGSRFRAAGIHTPKPMIPLAGKPLVQHTLERLETLGVSRVVMILNEQERDCAAWIQDRYSRFQLQIIVKSTASSFESFWRVGQALGPGRHLLSTVDSICAAGELRKMTVAPDPDGMYLGVTEFVDDEKPLWVKMDEKSRRISELGSSSGRWATAGFYSVPSGVFETAPAGEMKSLRYFLKGLCEEGVPLYGVPLAQVLDVDRPEDLAAAEKFLKDSINT